MSISAVTFACAVALAVAVTLLAAISPVDLNPTSSILAMPRSPVLAWVLAFRRRCDFAMQELGTFFAAPFGRFDGLVFARFLEFREGLVDQGPFHEAGEVDSLGKASPAGGVGVVGAVQHVVQKLQLGAGNVLAGLFPPVRPHVLGVRAEVG